MTTPPDPEPALDVATLEWVIAQAKEHETICARWRRYAMAAGICAVADHFQDVLDALREPRP